MVPVANQSLDENELFNLMKEIAEEAFIDIHSVETGRTLGIDLGSRNFETISIQK